MTRILSSEIVSLVHHVKLNESGWWEKVIQNIIISTFGSNSNLPLSESAVLESIIKDFNTGLDKGRLLKQFEILKNRKSVIPSNGGLFLLSEEVYSQFKSSFVKQKEIEYEAEKRFKELCYQLCPEMEQNTLWKELNEILIVPLIREIGAKTYELISGQNSLSIEQYGQFGNFVTRYKEDKVRVQALLLSYFDFKNENVKRYVLHQLSAYFFIEATNLNQQTVEEVYGLSKSQANLKIFVDTNFLLTLLDLHDNPSNEAAFALLELLEEIKNRIKVKFYVLPVTVFEFQNLIKKFKDHLRRIRPTLNQAVAAENSDEFSGIVRKYFQKCQEKRAMLDVDDYFDPYLDNFTVNLRKKGLEIQQDNMEKYSLDQRVIDDLLEQVEYRYERNLNSRKYDGLTDQEKALKKKNIYDKFNHDCQLWYYVKDKRPTYIDSTKEVTTWILTLDFSFLEFDKYKQFRDSNYSRITLCLHPNEFISMLQFWVPRTEKFEKAILGNFRLPFLFKEIDNESEKVSLEILRAMSQYEDSERFSSELVTEILTNKALRQKIKVSNTVEQNAALIKDELLRKYELAKEQLTQETAEKNSLTQELSTVRSELSSLSRKIDILQEKTNQKIVEELDSVRQAAILELKGRRENLKTKKEQLQHRLNDFEELVRKANLEFEIASRSFGSVLKSLVKGKERHRVDLRNAIHNKYYNNGKYETLKSELLQTDKEFSDLIVPAITEKIIIYCENRNSVYFNNLKFSNLHFVAEKDSTGVYIKVQANPTHFGLRDRDYLSDNEIERLQKAHRNYLILEYYCFENYLYHPENLLELKLPGFTNDWYLKELTTQKNQRYDRIVMNLKNVRNGYQEFKTPDNKIREKNDEIICEYLKSNDPEIFMKSFSLKTEFDKTALSKYRLTTEMLTSTDWFRRKIEAILTFRPHNPTAKARQ